jgi:transcriptional regulator with XRE-family HTH domain
MFATELKAELARLGMTQAEAAAVLDVSPRAVWKWLHGSEPLAVTAEGVLARLRKSKAKSGRDIPRLRCPDTPKQ